MKVAITVTAVYDFPDDVEIEDLVEGESLGQHIVVNGHKFQPFIDFDKYNPDADDDDEPAWNEDEDEKLEEVFEIIDDSLQSEEYLMVTCG